MDGPAAMRQCLMEMDVNGVRQLWHLIAPGLPQPKDDYEAIATMHYARTVMKLPQRARFYSHRWLLDHNMMSGLPDELRSKAEQMDSKIVSAVGIAMRSESDLIKPAVPIIRGAMENAVLEAYADGKEDDIPFVKQRMAEAKTTAMKKLFGKRYGK